MWQLATVRLPFTKLCVILQDYGSSERDKEGGRERRGVGVVGSNEEDETGGGGGDRGRPEKTDATTAAMALLDINSTEPHCASLIGNVSTFMLCLHHMLASK